jgi:hypothetical protein
MVDRSSFPAAEGDRPRPVTWDASSERLVPAKRPAGPVDRDAAGGTAGFALSAAITFDWVAGPGRPASGPGMIGGPPASATAALCSGGPAGRPDAGFAQGGVSAPPCPARLAGSAGWSGAAAKASGGSASSSVGLSCACASAGFGKPCAGENIDRKPSASTGAVDPRDGAPWRPVGPTRVCKRSSILGVRLICRHHLSPKGPYEFFTPLCHGFGKSLQLKASP